MISQVQIEISEQAHNEMINASFGNVPASMPARIAAASGGSG